MSSQVQIGWTDINVPLDTFVPTKDLLKSYAIRKGIKHVAVERGSKRAWKVARTLVKAINRLAVQAAKEGLWLQIHTTNQCTAPELWDRHGHSMALEVRAIKDGKIKWDIAVHGYSEMVEWQITGDTMLRSFNRADVVLRKIGSLYETRH